ncbi:MAG: Yip1 family protein [Bdellovibrionota bacterium]|jgi:hypothetical protein
MEMGENVKPDIEYPNAAMPETFNYEFISKRVLEVFSNKPEVWAKIRHEYADVKRIYLAYLLELIALFVLGDLLSHLFSDGFFNAIVMSIVTYIFTCAGIYISALLLVKLAPKFGCSVDIVSVLKLLAYTLTPVLVAGIFSFIEHLGTLIRLVAFLYTVYLLYSAISVLLDVPKEKRGVFFVLVLITILLANIALVGILSTIIIGSVVVIQ